MTVGNCLSAATARLDHQREHRDLDVLLLGVDRRAERFEIGDVGVVVLRDVRDHHPVAGEVRSRELLDARERHAFDRPELLEVDLRPRQQLQPEAAGDARRDGRRAVRERVFDEALHVVARDAAVRAACRARCRALTPSSRAKRRIAGLA